MKTLFIKLVVVTKYIHSYKAYHFLLKQKQKPTNIA